MLEMDLILTRFNRHYLGSLSDAECAAYARLLEKLDTELIELVYGRAAPADETESHIVALWRMPPSGPVPGEAPA